ncbi:class I SAM-dependent methyltransferase [Clostridiaceae bacterium M8S5]|nr:class I SAM-dependent methyltransferase [Clostridiaceae bacterium M8S5]
MNIKEKLIDFRTIDIDQYPELKGYGKDKLYDNFIGTGGMYLVTKMFRHMNLKKGDIVLDLGCGFGTTSIYLAEQFDVTVIAVDLWQSPSKLKDRICDNKYYNKIIPLNLDIVENIPFADNYFDAIFCMNSFFIFGDNDSFIEKLLKTLKVGGTFCMGSECFNQEPNFNASSIPEVYNFNWKWNIWDICYSKYHSPSWWKSKLKQTKLLEIKYCEELEEGIVFYEDLVLNYYDYFDEEIISKGMIISQESIANQITYSRNKELYPTVFILSGRRIKEK